MLTFQNAILALHEFWAAEGCLIWEPYYLQVGAGTMNPATFLRVLGPEPWRVAYVEPSVRPDDARYGENPNRMGLHYQYQVILKPEPGDPQELYLRSLEALGIDTRQHDIRFVEDNWEQPALGAWGLGWEVWLDGLEITQFTYFQQAGGQDLDPVSVELTYGLERILMAIQGASHFGDIRWNDHRTYGDVNLAAEQQHSRYYFEVADVGQLRGMFDGYEAEAQQGLEAGLTLPAYDMLLKCSHTFNVLDTRGAIGVTERASYFGRMRKIARAVAMAYLEERELAGHPWLLEESPAEVDAVPQEVKGPGKPADFVLEIGTEELPADDLTHALDQLKSGFDRLLTEARLEHGQIHVMGTPRRLAVLVENLAPRQQDLESEVKGPPWSSAFDADGKPTGAGAGFASSSGVSVEELREVERDGGTYAVATIREEGEPAWSALSQTLPEWISKLQFDKSMRWSHDGVSFSRPIRWLLVLHGGAVVPVEYGGLRSGNVSRGLRSSEHAELEIGSAAAYLEALEGAGILVDPAARRSEIQSQIDSLAADGQGAASVDPLLLDEVTNLVEAPQALLGTFEKDYLGLPRDVLTAVMMKHQRYFPVEADGELLPNFVVVSNGRQNSAEIVTTGNEQVIRARFADAEYFVTRDLEHPLENYVHKLGTLTFQADLGSMLDKTQRLEGLTATLAGEFEFPDGQSAVRAAQLCKADLATLMVVEMTSLQGSMGKYYAVKSGESEAVAEAIYEHYLPRHAGDELPSTQAGIVLALADRLDSLIGLFSIGAQPTGTRDPFGLRRSAVGLVQILIERELSLDLREALGWAWDGYDRKRHSKALEECLAFIVRRQRQLLLDRGFPHDVVNAVLEEQGHNPLRAALAASELQEWVQHADWATTLQAYSRCARIVREASDDFEFNEKRATEAATRVLFEALSTAEQSDRADGSVDDLLEAFEPMIPAIDRFFEEVMVMDEDETLRNNRLGLLQRVVRLATGVADFSKLEGF